MLEGEKASELQQLQHNIASLSDLKADVHQLYTLAEGQAQAPEVAINHCIGINGKYASGHSTFVIRKRATDNTAVWDANFSAEFKTLKDALDFPNATPYGSSTLCTPCRQFQPTVLAELKRKWELTY